jgi:hypothetical protein
MGWDGHVSSTEERIGTYRILTGIPQGKRPLVNSKRRWEDNITMGIQ